MKMLALKGNLEGNWSESVENWPEEKKLNAARGVVHFCTSPKYLKAINSVLDRDSQVILFQDFCAYGSGETVQLQLKKLTLDDSEANSAVYAAVAAGRPEMLNELEIRDHGHLTNILAACMSMKENVLLDTVKKYLPSTVLSNLSNQAGMNPLAYAAQNNNVNLMQYFYDKKPDWIDSGTPSPLYVAVDRGCCKAIKFLLNTSKVDMDHPGPDGITPLQMALLRKKKSILSLFGNNSDGTHLTQRNTEISNGAAGKLVQLTMKYPLFNENVDKAKENFNSKVSADKNLFELCKGSLLNSDGEPTQKVSEMQGPFNCNLSHSNKASCQLTQDLFLTLQTIEQEMNRIEGPFAKMKPYFTIIGSIVEGTRLSLGNEVDVMVMFEATHKPVLKLATHAGSAALTKAGAKVMSKYSDEHNCLDYMNFLCDLLEELSLIMATIKFPASISVNQNYKPCEQCLMNIPTETDPLMHCENCKPGVTMTKLGPCLVLTWTDTNKDLGPRKGITCTIDLIPSFKHEKGSLSLFKHVVKSLLHHKPPNWMKTIDSYLTRDRILPEQMSASMEAEESGEGSLVCFKIQHFEDDFTNFKFLLRPGQTVDIDALYSNEGLREVYVKIKYCKSMFGVEELSSYFIKKTLLQDNIKSLAKISPDLAWRAVMDGPLRRFRTQLEKIYEVD